MGSPGAWSARVRPGPLPAPAVACVSIRTFPYLAWRDAHVDQNGTSLVQDCDRRAYRLREVVRLDHGAEPLDTLRAGELCKVDVGIHNPLAHATVFNGSTACAGNTLLVLLVVEVGAVIGYHEQRRNAVMGSRPQRRWRHEQRAVADDADDRAARFFRPERRANGERRPGPDTRAAIAPQVRARLLEVPHTRRPCRGHVCQDRVRVALAERLAQLAHHARIADRTSVPGAFALRLPPCFELRAPPTMLLGAMLHLPPRRWVVAQRPFNGRHERGQRGVRR